MKTQSGVLTTVAVVTAAGMLAGCVTPASVDRGGAKAQDGAPEVAEVEVLHIAHNPAAPIYVIAVEPLAYAAVDVISGGGPQDAPQAGSGVLGFLGGGSGQSVVSSPNQWERQHDNAKMSAQSNKIGTGLAAQLTTALSNGGNIQVIEFAGLKKEKDGTYTCKLEKGEVGPFIIRGVVTEFSETADLSGEKKGGGLGRIGAAMGLLGSYTRNSALAVGGTGLAIADPKMESNKVKRSGMVGMDLKIVNGKNQRIVGGFASKGTFTTASATSGASVFGIGKSNTEFAASALGQATRAAMNDALKQTTTILTNKVRQ